MNRWVRFAGIAGLVLTAFGLLGAAIIGFGQVIEFPILIAHGVVGIGLIIVWAVTGGVGSVGTAGQVMAGRKARFTYNATLYIAVTVGLLGAMNWFANRNDKRWDLTEEGVYSLAPQTVSVVKNLKKPLKLVGLTGPAVARMGAEVENLKETFDLYKYNNPAQVTVELFDPKSKPQLVDKYQFKAGNVVYVEYGDGDSKGVSRLNEASEEAITNAVVKLQQGEAKKVYFVTGHQEPNIKSVNPDGLKAYVDALTDAHLTVAPILLAQTSTIPDDAAAVALISPKIPMLDSEKALLFDYVQKGGHLLMMHDPRTTHDVAELAGKFGIEIGNNVVLDQIQRLFAGPAIGAEPIVREYGSHPITKDFGENHITIYNIASTVKAKSPAPEGVKYTELMKTSASSWAESNLDGLFGDPPAAELDSNDVKGPVSVGVVYEKSVTPGDGKGDAKSSRVVVVGDSDWVLNANLGVFGNRDLAVNSVNWLAGEETSLSISPRTMRSSLAPMSADTYLKVLATSFLVPEIILLAGLIVWWRRKTVPA